MEDIDSLDYDTQVAIKQLDIEKTKTKKVKNRKKRSNVLLGSLIIVGFFALGVFLSYFGFIPELIAKSHLSTYALFALMFCVGFGIGSDTKTFWTLSSIT